MKAYNLPLTELFRKLETSEKGLSNDESIQRLKKFGYNKLPEKKKTSPLITLLMQFKDFMILVLITAALLSGIIGDVTDTIVISCIILLNATIGFIHEYKTEKAMEVLKKMATTYAQVIRDNSTQIIPTPEIVPGDIVLLETGAIVPADIRLTEVHSLFIDESSLTGESVPAEKNTEILNADHLPPGD